MSGENRVGESGEILRSAVILRISLSSRRWHKYLICPETCRQAWYITPYKFGAIAIPFPYSEEERFVPSILLINLMLQTIQGKGNIS
jgi:hypothetical protein